MEKVEPKIQTDRSRQVKNNEGSACVRLCGARSLREELAASCQRSPFLPFSPFLSSPPFLSDIQTSPSALSP